MTQCPQAVSSGRYRASVHTALRRHALSLCLLSVSSWFGCSNDPPTSGGLDVLVRTDLGSELTFVRAALLAESSDNVVSEHWFAVAQSCSDSSELHELFSFSVMKKERPTVRLQMTGYKGDATAGVVQLADYRVDAAFGKRNGVLVVDLRAACSTEAVECEAGETCDPDSGSCVAVPRVEHLATAALLGNVRDCAESVPEAPPPAPDVVIPVPVPVCLSGDGSCPEGCTRALDGDCGLERGKGCSADAHCQAGLSCIEGVCCTGGCNQPCESCNISGHAGECWPVPAEALNSTAHCGGCGRACGGTQFVGLTCEHGQCVYECNPGYRDCDGDPGVPNGCEQYVVNDPHHCGMCSQDCSSDGKGLPYCATGRCATTQGSSDSAERFEVPPGSVVGIQLYLAAGAVQALAARLEPSDLLDPGQVVLALAKRDGGENLPGTILCQTGLVPVINASDPSLSDLARWTHGPASCRVQEGGLHWLLLTTVKRIRLHASGARSSVYSEEAVGTTFFTDFQFFGNATTSVTPSLAAAVVDD